MARKSKKTISVDRWVKRNQGKHLCQCGCEEFIEIKREHHRPSVGIPKYVRGHNIDLIDDPSHQQFVEQQKKQSVWDRLAPEEQERRLNQLKSFGKGEANPAWKGGRRVDEYGYIYILYPEHPFASDGYVPEHRLIVEEFKRREDPDNPLLVEVEGIKYLNPTSVVHHIDENKQNNDISNLMLLKNQQFHAFIHKSPLPMEERLRRISLGICHSGPLEKPGGKND